MRRLGFYLLEVLADGTLSDNGSHTTPEAQRRKFDALSDLMLTPSHASGAIEAHMGSYDTRGYLRFEVAKEIMYAATPVEQALKMFGQLGITDEPLINKTLLTGNWSPKGFIENAQVVANNAKK